VFFLVAGVVLAIGNSSTDFFSGEMKPILIWAGAALVVGLLAACVFWRFSEKFGASLLGVMGGVILTTFILGLVATPNWLNIVLLIIVCCVTGYYGYKYDDKIKAIGTAGCGAFMIVYGIASFFDAFPSLSGGVEQEFKWYYIVDLVGWLLLFWAGW
jgi:hypothetical protein